MARIAGVDPQTADLTLKRIFESQTAKWGGPLLNHLIYARRPSIFRGARGMWAGIDESHLIAPELQALINRRVAFHNGCVF